MRNVNVGVFGSYASGKTSLVEALKQRKGMGTEGDICFYSYKVRDTNVTLIDVPGDPRKIQPMIYAANLCDAALITIDCSRGFDYQTGEAIIALKLAGVSKGVIALTKSDQVTPEDVDALRSKVRALLKGTPFEESPMFDVSTITGANVPQLMDFLANIEVERKKEGSFKMPVDHSIEPKSGFTVVTGIVHQGEVKSKDKVKLMPWDKEMIVQSIEVHGQEIDKAEAGDRIAMGFKGIHYHDVVRGDVVCGVDSPLRKTKNITLEFEVEKFYKETVAKDQRLHLCIGLQFYPVIVKSIKDGSEVKAGEKCTLELESERLFFAVEDGDRAILCRPELPWRMLRICGGGKVVS